MDSQYLHSKALADAYKRLYMLGNRPERRPRNNPGEAVGGAISGMAKKQSSDLKKRQDEQAAIRALNDKARAETADTSNFSEDDKEQFDRDVEFIKGPKAVGQGLAMPTYDPYAAASAQLKVNAAARNAPVRGDMGPVAARAIGAEADKETQDILLAKKMMAQGAIANGMMGTDPLVGGY